MPRTPNSPPLPGDFPKGPAAIRNAIRQESYETVAKEEHTPEPQAEPAAEATPREAKQLLRERVEELEKLQAPGADIRQVRREARAQLFAERYGIRIEREEMIGAERNYQKALADHYSENIRAPWKKVPAEVQEQYDAARLKWRNALLEATKDAPDQERQIATIISFKDTVMRAEEARLAAHEQGLDIRSKTIFGKLIQGSRVAASAIPKGYLKGTEKAGAWFARNSQGQEGYEEKVKKYVRATRILSSAALGTLLFGGIGAAGTAGVLLGVAVRAGRGVIGVTVGTAAGYGAGALYKKTLGSSFNKDLRDAKRNQNSSNFQKLEKDYRRGNAGARANQQRVTEMLGALLGGGAAAWGSNAAVQSWFAESPTVQQAVEQVERIENESAPTEGQDVPEKVVSEPGKVSAPAEITQVDDGAIEPVIKLGEGANSLFFDLKEQLREQYPDASKAPATVQHLLQDKGAVEWSRAFGFFKVENGEIVSRIMHEGDTLTVNPQTGELVFHDEFTGKSVVLMDAKGNPVAGAYEKISAGIPYTPPSVVPTVNESIPVVETEIPREQEVRSNVTPSPEPLTDTPMKETEEKLTIEDTFSKPAPMDIQPEATISNRPLTVDDVIGSSTQAPTHVAEPPMHVDQEPLTVDKTFVQPFTNTHGVEINPAEPVRYSWQLPNSDATFQVIYGGTPEAASNEALRYVQEHANCTVLFKDVRYDEFGRAHEYMRAWTMGATGQPELIEPPNPYSHGIGLPVVQPNDLIARPEE